MTSLIILKQKIFVSGAFNGVTNNRGRRPDMLYMLYTCCQGTELMETYPKAVVINMWLYLGIHPFLICKILD